ncbi:MAG: IscS subfamily cysteine desulfurase [Candidatus Acidiferrales bacterium]
MPIKLPIYLDNHATTPVDPRVLEAMLPYFTENFGNAASRNHEFGWKAEEAVENARGQIAHLIGASPKEIVFTSGATESINLALKGAAEFYRDKGNHIIALATEHKAVLDTCKRLEYGGCEITFLPVGSDGLVDPEDVSRAITPRTILISVLHGNNEIGVLQPVSGIGQIAKKAGALFHVDAAQSVGKIPINVENDSIDVMSISGHKIYAPKGVGALYVRRKNPRVQLTAQMDGGGHERGLRSGTLNVPGIVGVGKACEICEKEMASEGERLFRLRERLRVAILGRLDGVSVNGSLEHRLPNNLNLSFSGVEGEALLMGIHGVAVSSGSACTSAQLAASHVLRAIGVDDDLAHASIRFGLGRFNTEEEVDYAAGRVVETVQKLRELSPAYQSAKGRKR